MQTIFSRSPWERPSVVEIDSPALGETSPNCEPTPEGGQRCTDGTYLPPGCGTGSPAAVQGQPLIAPFPVVPVALAIAGVSAAATILLSGERRLGVPPDYPSSVFARIEEISNAIKGERAADSWNHSRAILKTKEHLQLVDKQRVAEAALAAENLLWEETHRNAESLQAAQTKLDEIDAQRAAALSAAEDYRAKVAQNAQNILYYRQQALNLIATMPPAYQGDARRMIDPCYKEPMALKGVFLGQVPMSDRFSWNRAPGVYRGGSQYQLYSRAPRPVAPPREAVEEEAPSYGSGPFSGFNGFGDVMMTGAPFTHPMTTEVVSYGGAMMGVRYPVVNR